MKILVVDDDATSVQVVEAVLERMGHDVITRSDATGVLSAVAQEKPDVALVDVRMPGLGGDRLASVLVANRPSMTVLLHSSLPGRELALLATAAGAAGYIEKTGDPALFLRAFQSLVDPRSTGSGPRRPPSR